MPIFTGKSISRFSAIALVITASALMTNAAVAKKLDDKSDGSWVSLKGSVVAREDNSLLLDYGENTITVELDDWEQSQEAARVLAGAQVTVYGEVDDDFYENRTIEAQSIYIEQTNTVLSGPSPHDDEGKQNEHPYTYYAGPSEHDMEVTGFVTSINGRTFTIDTGERKLKVNTAMMADNPMDETGFQQIKEGDWVRASGDVGMNTFEDREIMAESVVSLD